MEQQDLNRLTMWKTVYIVLQDYQGVWQVNEGFSEAVTDLKGFIKAADAASGSQAAGRTTGITADKETLADDAINKTLRVTKIARAYARKINNQTLLSAVDYAKGSLQKTPLDELTARLNSMLKAVQGVADALQRWGFVKGSDESAAAAIEAFSKAAQGTRVAISGGKAMTATLPQIMRGGKTELLIIDDLIGMYEEEAPQFVLTYKAARNIVDVGIRHDPAQGS